ncbi:MAG: hypothetical protein M0025_07855 [Elusimicrobia bacterium]|nr:hypothetical protein [Elusimicrobiota bacterium]
MALFNPRTWSLDETPAGPRVIIPSPFLWPLAVFLGLWLSAWAEGEFSAAREIWRLLHPAAGQVAVFPAAFLLVWLALWTAGGAFALGALLFCLRGSEVLELREGRLRVKLETFLGLGWSRYFEPGELEPLSLFSARELAADRRVSALTMASGLGVPDLSGILLKSGARRWALGLGLSGQAARELLYTLGSRFGLRLAEAGWKR